MPSLAKSPTENHISVADQNKSTNRTIGIKDYSDERKVISNNKYRTVKVNMDGAPIGRKVDLNSHTSYEMLAQTLEEMFWGRRKFVFSFYYYTSQASYALLMANHQKVQSTINFLSIYATTF